MDKDILERLVMEGKTNREIGMILGKSGKTVEYWYKKYGFDSRYSFLDANGNIRKKQTTFIDKHNWEEIQKFYDEGNGFIEVSKKFDVCSSHLSKAVKLNKLKRRTEAENRQMFPERYTYKTPKEHLDKMMEGSKKFWKENLDKHPWNQPKSKPCENVKSFLKSQDISFIEEFPAGVKGRRFSIDIALPDKMIAIEVNGGTHYQKDGTLTPYHQERHDLISQNGWMVFEICTKACFNFKNSTWKDLIDLIKNSMPMKSFDYFTYAPSKKPTEDICHLCGGSKKIGSNKCLPCQRASRRKPIPSKNELLDLVGKIPLVKIAKIYSVGRSTVDSWCRKYGIKIRLRQGKGPFVRKRCIV